MLKEKYDVFDIELPKEIIESLARALLPEIRSCYTIEDENVENQRNFLPKLQQKESQV